MREQMTTSPNHLKSRSCQLVSGHCCGERIESPKLLNIAKFSVTASLLQSPKDLRQFGAKQQSNSPILNLNFCTACYSDMGKPYRQVKFSKRFGVTIQMTILKQLGYIFGICEPRWNQIPVGPSISKQFTVQAIVWNSKTIEKRRKNQLEQIPSIKS